VTFGAMAAWQAWLLLAGAAALAAALFLIKLRPPRLLIPSVLIWSRVLGDIRQQTLWERIRRAVSLIATVIIALALALAVVRPGRVADGGTRAAGRLLVVLDASWSMEAATRRGETRWERAVAEARRLFASSSGAEMALATTADGLVEGPTTDLALIETALERSRAGGGDATAWPRLAGATAVHFITDGATARPLDSSVVVHSVFEPAPNVGITALEVRPSLTPGNAGDAYLEIGNFAPSGQKVRVRINRGATEVLNRELDAAPSELLRQVLPIPRGGDPSLTVRVDAPENALAEDDEAFAWVARARPLVVTVVGTQTQWLRAAFERDPDVRATFVDPAGYTALPATPNARPDVTIFDRWAPSDPPAGPALLFAPAAGTRWLSAGADAASPGPAADERAPKWEIPGSHPVVQGVDPFTLTVERARAYSAPSLVPVAQSAHGTPLVYVSESPDIRLVIVTFSINESNLTAAPGFPVLLGNAVDWLARPVLFASPSGDADLASRVQRPGLTAFAGVVTKVTGPASTDVPLTRVGQTAFARIRVPGIYTVHGGGTRSTFAVNLADPQLSDLARTTPVASGRVITVAAGALGAPWWVYCAAAAFALALAEWWTWQRRITV
jgi:hypothetical protein